MALGKQVRPIRLSGLDNKSDPKQSVDTTIDVLENMFATRRTDGGIELRKRFGITAITRSIASGGSLGAGSRVQSLGNELVATDGLILYSYSPTENVWVTKGFVHDIAARITAINGNVDTGETTSQAQPVDCDSAAIGNYVCYVEGRSGVLAAPRGEWFIQDLQTDEIVGNGTVDASYVCNVRVTAVGTAFFIFWWDGIGTLKCKKISTTTPATIGAAFTVASDINTLYGIYDVIADSVNSRTLVAYRNTTPKLTIMSWLTGMTAGTTTVYASLDPDLCIGFLDNTTTAPAHVGAASSASGTHLLTFNTTTLVVSANVTIDPAVNVLNVTGYYDSATTTPNVLYTLGTVGSGTTALDNVIMAYNGTGFGEYIRGVTIRSRPFTTDGNSRYFLGAYVAQDGDYTQQRSLYLFQVDKNTASFSGLRISGFLFNDNFGMIGDARHSPGVCVVISSTRVLCVAATAEPFASSSGSQAALWTLRRIELDYSGSLTGNMIQFNGVLMIPGAAARVYDGKTVFENGFYVRPDKPVLAQTGGGTVTLLALVQFVVVYSYVDNSGRLWRSAPSGVGSITLTGANNKITGTAHACNVTDRFGSRSLSPAGSHTSDGVSLCKIEIYATKPNESVFFLHDVIANVPTAFTVSFTYSFNEPGVTEVLYTQGGEVANEYPPAVLSFCGHRDRLFALSGDQATWYTKETVDGVANACAALFRIPFDVAAGQFVGLASLDAGLVVAKRSRIYLVVGDGPTPDGNSPFAYPIPLPAEVGFASARAFCNVQDGVLFMSAKGMQLLDRGGSVTPVEGIDSFTSYTITGGVALDDRPYAVFSTSQGSTLVYDWQFKQWYVWTGQAAVSCARWNNSLVLLSTNGTVNVETAGSYADNGAGFTQKANVGWINLGDTFSNGRLYSVHLLLEPMAACTASVTLSYDYDTANADAAKTKALTSADKGIFVLRPGQRRSQVVYISMSSTSTTEGFRISSIGIEVGQKSGMRKQPSTKFLT